jgi:hypothetical protein
LRFLGAAFFLVAFFFAMKITPLSFYPSRHYIEIDVRGVATRITIMKIVYHIFFRQEVFYFTSRIKPSALTKKRMDDMNKSG